MQTFDGTIQEIKFIGMNDRWPSHLLPPGMFQNLDNIVIENNILSKRMGNTKVAPTLGAAAILGVSAFEPSGGTKLLIACLDGGSNSQLYKWTGSGSFSAIGSNNLTAGAQMNFVQASNRIFGFNGTDVVDYDGTTVTKNRATIPLGQFGFWFHNYLFVAGVSGNTSRLYWSDLGTPTTFTNTNFIDINANDGDQITALAALNDELFIFKNNSIWSISGWSGASFSATSISGQNTNSRIYGYGTPSHQSVVNTGKDLYYLSFLGSVPHFRCLTQTVFAKVIDAGVISFDIQTTMDGLNKSQLSKCAGVYDGRRIFWAVPNGSSTYNNLVLVNRPDIVVPTEFGEVRSWARYTTGMNPSQFALSTISGRQKIYYGDATTGGLVIEKDTSVYTDDGVAIVADIKTRDYMVNPAKKIKWKYMYLKYKSPSSGTLVLKARGDQAQSFTTQGSISMAGNSPGLGPTGTFTLGVSALGGQAISKYRFTFAQIVSTLLGLEFTESTSNSLDLYDYQIFGHKKGLRNS